MVTTVDEYISQFPAQAQERLRHMRLIVRAAAPEAAEKISWAMPTYAYYGNLVHFAAHKQHLGFYPGASGIQKYRDKLQGFKMSKGAVQFPYTKALPEALIREIVAFRLAENKQEAEEKAAQKKQGGK